MDTNCCFELGRCLGLKLLSEEMRITTRKRLGF